MKEEYVQYLHDKYKCLILSPEKVAHEIPQKIGWLYDMRMLGLGIPFYKDNSTNNGEVLYRIDILAHYYKCCHEQQSIHQQKEEGYRTLQSLLYKKYNRHNLSRKEAHKELGRSSAWLDRRVKSARKKAPKSTKNGSAKSAHINYTIDSIVDYIMNLEITQTS